MKLTLTQELILDVVNMTGSMTLKGVRQLKAADQLLSMGLISITTTKILDVTFFQATVKES